MLSSVLSKQKCAECKFCCSFRRQSLWETPVFTRQEVDKLKELYPDVKFRSTGKNSFTIDLSNCYKTSDPQEEAACPFLDTSNGCILPKELKPFDCSIWPLRAVKMPDGTTTVALTPTCPEINKVPVEKICELLQNGLEEKILQQAKNNPDMLKEFSSFFKLLYIKS